MDAPVVPAGYPCSAVTLSWSSERPMMGSVLVPEFLAVGREELAAGKVCSLQDWLVVGAFLNE